MGIFSNVTVLELAEAYAEDNNSPYSSQDAVNEYFDEHIAPMVLENYDEDDTIAFTEAFNDWTDSLCKDGELHESQYNEYSYEGKYS